MKKVFLLLALVSATALVTSCGSKNSTPTEQPTEQPSVGPVDTESPVDGVENPDTQEPVK